MAAERAREVIEVPPAAPPPRRQVAAVRTWDETPPPQDFRVTIHSGKDGIDRYNYRGRDYRSRDVYLPRPGDRDDDFGASDEEGEPDVSD
jgi:hypothetical protein